MKLLTGLVFCSLILGVSSIFSFITEAAQGKAEGGGLSPKATRFTWCGPVLVEAGEARARGDRSQAFPAGFLQLTKEVLAPTYGVPRLQLGGTWCSQGPISGRGFVALGSAHQVEKGAELHAQGSPETRRMEPGFQVLGHVEAYSDMREANYINADKYFHARRNFDAARRGPGGAWAAEVLRGNIKGLTGHGAEDTAADQAANEWGRSGKDPNHFRPAGLPDKY
ncbi:Serum amyloid A-1 protein [Tupaia chinensis]|uniref:Serum amyloid A-1 protein n=1 Tax=Tupaia chinensis TaxID=246437 RepID=L9L6Y4_TUPCH|nr:Serum amyloid A-1 protein [Tupaia chinensis]